MKLRSLLPALGVLVTLGAGASASGLEVKGVIGSQSISPGDYMNPPFTGKIDINLHFPKTQNAATGLMVVLHGLGGDFHQYDTECESWVNDYNVFTVQINYRGTGNPPPGYDLGKYQAVDVLRVVKYVFDQYGLNKKRIFLWGASAGGNVALHTAKMAPRTFALVAALSPITRPSDESDRLLRGYEADPAGGWETFMLGSTRKYTTEEWDIRDAQYLAPYLTGLPVFLIHGDRDPLVDVQHSTDMHAALVAAGGQVTFVTVKGGDHDLKGALDPTENSRFKATQKYLKSALSSYTTNGNLDHELQTKVTFPTRGATAFPVKFDVNGLCTLDSITKPGAVVCLAMTRRAIKQGESLAFGLTIDNWLNAAQPTVILAGLYRLSNAAVLPLVGPVPFVLPAAGVKGPVSIPITTAFPTGEYLFVAIVVGAAPSAFVDLDYFQFTVAAAGP
jgi:predicted esterase